jgi:hypothetical protein
MPPVFPLLVGSGRSGTTLFRNVLDTHPEMAMTHEAHFVAPMAVRRRRYEHGSGFDTAAFLGDLYANPNFARQGVARDALAADLAATPPTGYAEAVRAVFARYAADHGKPRYGDKTPGYVSHIPLLADLFPEARFVHIVRDGRDVAMSYLDRSEWGPATLSEAAHYWRDRVGRGRAAGRTLGPERYREVRYEDMVDDPETTTRTLCEFLDLDFRPELLRFHERGHEFIASSATPEAFSGLAKPVTRGMRNWRTEMARDDVVFFEAVAGDLLSDLGYERVTMRPSAAMQARATAGRLAWQAKRVAAKLRPTIRRLRRLGRS